MRGIEPLGHAGASRRAHPRGSRRIAQDRLDRGDEATVVVGVDEQSGDAVLDHLADRPDAERDHRQAHRHRLEDRIRRQVHLAREGEDGGGSEDGRKPPVAGADVVEDPHSGARRDLVEGDEVEVGERRQMFVVERAGDGARPSGRASDRRRRVVGAPRVAAAAEQAWQRHAERDDADAVMGDAIGGDRLRRPPRMRDDQRCRVVHPTLEGLDRPERPRRPTGRVPVREAEGVLQRSCRPATRPWAVVARCPCSAAPRCACRRAPRRRQRGDVPGPSGRGRSGRAGSAAAGGPASSPASPGTGAAASLRTRPGAGTS